MSKWQGEYNDQRRWQLSGHVLQCNYMITDTSRVMPRAGKLPATVDKDSNKYTIYVYKYTIHVYKYTIHVYKYKIYVYKYTIHVYNYTIAIRNCIKGLMQICQGAVRSCGNNWLTGKFSICRLLPLDILIIFV